MMGTRAFESCRAGHSPLGVGTFSGKTVGRPACLLRHRRELHPDDAGPLTVAGAGGARVEPVTIGAVALVTLVVTRLRLADPDTTLDEL